MAFHDVHRETAAQVLGIPPEEVTEEQRRWVGKTINFGRHYGMGRERLLETLERNAPASGMVRGKPGGRPSGPGSNAASCSIPIVLGDACFDVPDDWLWWWG